MNPDVIFFLTDADEPSLSAKQLAHIARQNGGAHAYVDIAELPRPVDD